MQKMKTSIACSNVGKDMKLTRPAFFRLAEDVSLLDAEHLGIGCKPTMERNQIWVFARVYVEFYRYPSYLEEVELLTTTAPRALFSFPRFVEMKTSKGETLAKLSSFWMLLDKYKRTAILKPDFVTPDSRDGNELPFPGRVYKEEDKKIYQRKIEYSDIDLNVHLNNTRYIEIIDDALGEEFLDHHEIRSMLINYEKEIRLGSIVEVYANEDKTYIRGAVGGMTCFEAKLAYKSN